MKTTASTKKKQPKQPEPIISAERLKKLQTMLVTMASAYAELGGAERIQECGDDIFHQIGMQYRAAMCDLLCRKKLLRELSGDDFVKFPLSASNAALAIRPQDFQAGIPLPNSRAGFMAMRSDSAVITYRIVDGGFQISFLTDQGRPGEKKTYIEDDLFGCEQHIQLAGNTSFTCGYCRDAVQELYLDFSEYNALMAFACVPCQTWDSDTAIKRYKTERAYVSVGPERRTV